MPPSFGKGRQPEAKKYLILISVSVIIGLVIVTLPKRKANRLKDYDYSSEGAYFITICTKQKKKVLCDIVRVDDLGDPKVVLTDIGKIVDKYIVSANKIKEVKIDKYVVMPNHIHMIVLVSNTGGSPRSSTHTSATVQK